MTLRQFDHRDCSASLTLFLGKTGKPQVHMIMPCNLTITQRHAVWFDVSNSGRSSLLTQQQGGFTRCHCRSLCWLCKLGRLSPMRILPRQLPAYTSRQLPDGSTQQIVRATASGSITLLGHPDHGCPRCSVPGDKLHPHEIYANGDGFLLVAPHLVA